MLLYSHCLQFLYIVCLKPSHQRVFEDSIVPDFHLSETVVYIFVGGH